MAKTQTKEGKVQKRSRAKQTKRKDVAVPQPSPAEALGQVVWLMNNSASHKHLFLSDLEWLVMPPLQLKQYRLIRSGEELVGFISWAFLSEEVEQRLITGNTRLSPADWHSGPNMWLIDILAKGGRKKELLDLVGGEIFKGQAVKTLRPRLDGKGLEGVSLSDLID